MATYFFLTRGLDLQEEAKLLLYNSTTNSEAQTPTYVCGGFNVVHALSANEHKHSPARIR